ncbi:MAG TPA: DUF488 family protein [Dehalococcoidia bacterium]|nr:DUF488 family protein [Dehalococcoidia bacterium]
MPLSLKRAYEPSSREDGERYLVERLWPRGVSKEALRLTAWLKDVAPSEGLRRWYGHRPERWEEFRRRYLAELEQPEKRPLLDDLRAKAKAGPVTLVFAARDAERSGARVLRDYLEGRPPGAKEAATKG